MDMRKTIARVCMRLERLCTWQTAVILGICDAFILYHLAQYAYIVHFFGIDAPFEDWTVFSRMYYLVNDMLQVVITTLQEL